MIRRIFTTHQPYPGRRAEEIVIVGDRITYSYYTDSGSKIVKQWRPEEFEAVMNTKRFNVFDTKEVGVERLQNKGM